MMRFVLALAAVLAFSGAANACQHSYQGKTICGHSKRTYVSRETFRRCPSHLGCGCHLAKYLGIADPKRRLWRARNWLHVGSRTYHGCVGCVVVLSRGRGGHVGIVKGYDGNGNPIAYSWGNGRVRWFTKTYSRRRVLGYVAGL